MPAPLLALDRRSPTVARAFTLSRSRGQGARGGAPVGIDLFADGVNLTARLGHLPAIPLLRDIALGVADLARGRKSRITVFLGAEGWILGIERTGSVGLLTLFRAGPSPEVVVFERGVLGGALVNGVLDAIQGLDGDDRVETALAGELDVARSLLAAAAWPEGEPAKDAAPQRLEAEIAAPVNLAAELFLRPNDDAPSSVDVIERSDLFPLLFRGKLLVSSGDRTREVGDAFVFLVAEQLLALSREMLEAWEQGRGFYWRIEVSEIVLAARLNSQRVTLPAGEKPAWFTIGGPRTSGMRDAWTFGFEDVPLLSRVILGFSRELCRLVLRWRPSEAKNLRLVAFQQAVQELETRLSDAVADDVKVNPQADGYRAFAARTRKVDATANRIVTPAKIRYAARWMATVPGLDLRGTFLCGDRLIVGANRETICLDRTTGDVLWRCPTPRAVSVVTPAGLARIHADGTLAVHDFATGEINVTTRITPKLGGAASGAVVHLPGLPRLLIVAEAQRHLSAVDLGSGEIRWRYEAHRGDTFRLRRAGKLLIVAAGDAALTALDVQSGEVVWRVRDRLRFVTQVGLDHDSLFAVAGESKVSSRGLLRIHHLDPYAGTTRWVRDVPEGALPFGAPLVADDAVIVPVRDATGLGLLALARGSGDLLWSMNPGRAPHRTDWLIVDGVLVRNTDAGEVVGVATATGETLWQHAFPRGMEGDQPRRLEPILRSGALFVPQGDVHVIRPRDGAILGRVGGEIIPDLLRVDERCDVYLAEESGHLAAYRAGARLSLV